MNENELSQLVDKQRVYFSAKETISYQFRVNQLLKLRDAIKKYESDFIAALEHDLGKSEFESYLTEIGYILYELSHTLKNLKKWMKSKKIRTPLINQPASSRIHYSPLGVNLIIAPFNYPFMLTFSPLIAAMAAGNTAVIKTSELTPNISKLIHKLIKDTFTEEYIIHVEGEIHETTLLLKQKFDHVFFTGSPRVGSIVMSAAAKNLTPVTLELGGKSPCIVHVDANLDIAVNRIVYGKFMNAGQTCIAPDYIMVHKDIKEDFLERLKNRIIKLYGEDASLSPEFGRIVSEQHLERLLSLIKKDKVVVGGKWDKITKFLAPTVMRDISKQDDVMQTEIFGPILPVLDYSDIDELLMDIKDVSHHPLAAYIFSDSRFIQDKVTLGLQFGGGCINHCLQHIGNVNLPFGGVGESGIGSYHGFVGFERFSHKKSIIKVVTWFDLKLLYPPFSKLKLRLLRMFFK